MYRLIYSVFYLTLVFVIPMQEMFADVALVTGASGGIGSALTRQLLDEDIKVIAVVRNKESLAELSHEYPQLQIIEADLSQLDSLGALTKKIKEPSIDYLVHNAAIVEPVGINALLEAPLPSIKRALEVNLLAPILLTAALQSKLGKGCRILNVSSGAGDEPCQGLGIYCVSKAGLDMYTKSLQLDQPHGVLSASVHPGMVDTNMQRDVRNKNSKEFPAAAYFRKCYKEGKLISAEDSAKFLTRLLLRTSDEDFVKNKHYYH